MRVGGGLMLAVAGPKLAKRGTVARGLWPYLSSNRPDSRRYLPIARRIGAMINGWPANVRVIA